MKVLDQRSKQPVDRAMFNVPTPIIPRPNTAKMYGIAGDVCGGVLEIKE